MDCQEYKEIIAAHVDRALSSGERLEAESHLERCFICKQEFLWESGAKKIIRRKLPSVPLRPGLRERLSDQLGETPKRGFFARFSMAHGLATAFALLLIAAAPYLLRWDKTDDELFADTIVQYQKLARGIGITPKADSPQTPAARLLDLSPWGYRVLTKQTKHVGGREERVFVYQGQDKEYLLAQEFDGGNFSAPNNAKFIRASNHDFLSYGREGVNLIAWKEKNLLCIIASDLPKEKLLGLARQITTGG